MSVAAGSAQQTAQPQMGVAAAQQTAQQTAQPQMGVAAAQQTAQQTAQPQMGVAAGQQNPQPDQPSLGRLQIFTPPPAAPAQPVTPHGIATQAVTLPPVPAQAVPPAPATLRAVTPPPAAKPPVQVTTATAGLTLDGNGTLTPTGTANLAFPASGIGGSLPLSLPATSLAQSGQPTQLAFPPAEQNAALSDPVVQGLIENLGQQAPSVPLPAPIPNLLQDVAPPAPATAPAANPIASTGTPVQLASLGNVLSDAPQPGAFLLAGQPAANGFGTSGNAVTSDASQLPAGSFQTAAGDTIQPSQGSILMVQRGFFGTTIKPLDPGAEMTLPDGTRVQVTHDNFLEVTPPGGPAYDIAPGNSYNLPDGNQIMVPTTPPVVIHDPGNGDAVLQPGFHVTTNDGRTIEVTQDGVLRVTNPDGHAVDYAPGSTYTLQAGTSISVMTPPQAMNLDQNPATQFGSAPAAGNQVAVNNVDPNGNLIMSDAGQLPVQLAQNQAVQPSITSDSITVVYPDGTPHTFPLGTSDNPVAPPTFGAGNEILVPLGTQVPLPNGGSTTITDPGTLSFPNSSLPAIHAVPAMPTSDNAPAGPTAVAVNNTGPAQAAPAPQPPAQDAAVPAPADSAQPPADATTPPAPGSAQPPSAQPPADTAPAPASTGTGTGTGRRGSATRGHHPATCRRHGPGHGAGSGAGEPGPDPGRHGPSASGPGAGASGPGPTTGRPGPADGGPGAAAGSAQQPG